jgi:anti-anti-sigma factor
MAPLYFSRLKSQSIDTETINGYLLYTIKVDLALGADFGVLTDMITKAIQKGNINIAIKFTPRSFLYTPTVARLVDYYKLVNEKGGSLCLVKPNDEILDVLKTIGFAKLVRIVPSVQEI